MYTFLYIGLFYVPPGKHLLMTFLLAAAAIRKAEAYNEAFWDTMHTGMLHNAL